MSGSARSLIDAAQERDEFHVLVACVANALSTKPRLGLYKIKGLLAASNDGHRAAMIRFRFQSGTFMLHRCHD